MNAAKPLECKQCTLCATALPLASFTKDARLKSGYAAICKPCKKQKDREYYRAHSKEIITRATAWNAAHPDLAKRYRTKCEADPARKARKLQLAKERCARPAVSARNKMRRRLRAERPKTLVSEKVCTKCSTKRPACDFYQHKASLDGLTTMCKACFSAHHRAYYARTAEAAKRRAARWYAANKDRAASLCRVWAANNPDLVRSIKALSRAARRQRTPAWLSEQHLRTIQQIYKECPAGYHVDHIVPLLGKTVSGLHVPWNLQHLPADENLRKRNSFISEAVCLQ